MFVAVVMLPLGCRLREGPRWHKALRLKSFLSCFGTFSHVRKLEDRRTCRNPPRQHGKKRKSCYELRHLTSEAEVAFGDVVSSVVVSCLVHSIG